MFSPGEFFLPVGGVVPILTTFGLEDSSSSGISLTLEDLPRRITFGLEEDVKLELGPDDVNVPVPNEGGMCPSWEFDKSLYNGNFEVDELPSLVMFGLED